jgi:hypothetical protein
MIQSGSGQREYGLFPVFNPGHGFLCFIEKAGIQAE